MLSSPLDPGRPLPLIDFYSRGFGSGSEGRRSKSRGNMHLLSQASLDFFSPRTEREAHLRLLVSPLKTWQQAAASLASLLSPGSEYNCLDSVVCSSSLCSQVLTSSETTEDTLALFAG